MAIRITTKGKLQKENVPVTECKTVTNSELKDTKHGTVRVTKTSKR